MEKIMLVVLAGILIAAVSFYIQIRPRLGNRYFGIDTWRHLAVADYIREHKKYPHLMPHHYLIDEPSDYPPLLRIMLSVIPKGVLERYQWLVSPVFDFLHNLLLFAVVYILTGNLMLAVTAQVIYMVSPLIIMENSSLTTRSLASLLFSMVFLSMLIFSTTKSLTALCAAVLFLSILLLTHRMSIQAFVFIVLFFSLYEKTFIYIAMSCAGFIIAVIVSKGYYLKVLRGHIAMLNFWRKNIVNRYAHQIRGLMKKGESNPDIVFRIYQIVRSLPAIAVFAANPFVIIVPGFLILKKKLFFHFDYMGIPEELFFKLCLWSVGMLVIAILVRQIRAIEFTGEGERYLEYSAFPTAIVSAVILLNGLNSEHKWIFLTVFFTVGILASLLPALFIQNKVVAKDTQRSVREPLNKIFAFLNSRQEEIRLMTIPLYLADAAMYFTRAKVLSTDSSIAHVVNYPDFFPVLKKPLGDTLNRYGINYLLINENYVKLSELRLEENMVLSREEKFCLIDVSNLLR
ncbi:MAG: hypothetical protein ABH836_07070 [Candidatus Omnitrophota bacterium]